MPTFEKFVGSGSTFKVEDFFKTIPVLLGVTLYSIKRKKCAIFWRPYLMYN